MKVRFIYSATTVIETPDLRILTDPWFTPGWAYDGAWGQYPMIADPISVIGEVDLIYISHCHPDHYDPPFLRRYLARYPKARLLCGELKYLAPMMRRDGFQPIDTVLHRVGAKTWLQIVPNRIGLDPIDTALVVMHENQSVVNMNDNPFDIEQLAAINRMTGGTCDVALLPYSGAGPYPQTFWFPTPEALQAAAARKRQQFLDGFHQYRKALQPRYAVPFAGQYWLTGARAHLNPLRGVPDPVELLDSAPGVVVLDTNGVIDTEAGVVGPVRMAPWAQSAIDQVLRRQNFGDPWADRSEDPFVAAKRCVLDRPLPIGPLLKAAVVRANVAIPITPEHWSVTFETEQGVWSVYPGSTSVGGGGSYSLADSYPPSWIITLPARYLFGLLTRLWHWNNAEVGSLFRSRREPDVFRPELSAWLAHLHV